MSYLKDNSIKEMENNILYFDTDRFTNYKYYIFFFVESSHEYQEGIMAQKSTQLHYN